MNLFRRNKVRVCGPAMCLQELEPRIVLDASLGFGFAPDPFDSLDWAQQPVLPSSAPQDHGQSGSELGTAPGSQESSGRNMSAVLVSDSLPQKDRIAEALPSGSHLVVYEATSDNLDTITARLEDLSDAQGEKIGSIAVIDHSQRGVALFGTDRIDLSNIHIYQQQFERLGRTLSPDGQIQFYGCSLAQDDGGKTLLNIVSGFSGADVFASVNPTGQSPRGDWTLEYSTNPAVQAATIFDQEIIGDIPISLDMGDVVITTGTVGPFSQGVTTVNLGNAFSVSNEEVEQDMTVVLLANPASSQGWSAISVDTSFAGALGVTVTGSGTTQITLTATDAGSVSGVLGTLQGTITDDFNGNAQILIFARDPDGDWAAATLDVFVNKPPHIIVPGNQTLNTNSTLTIIPSLSVIDTLTEAPLTVSLMVTHGTLSLKSDALTPLTFYTGDGTNDSVMVFSGKSGDINTAFSRMTYAPVTNFTGADTLSLSVSDQTTPVPGSDTRAIALTVINTAPTLIMPGTQNTIPEQAIAISPEIVVADGEAGVNPIEMTLSVRQGVLSLSQTTGLSFETGTGTNNSYVVFSGTVTDINSALRGMTYTPTAHFAGSDTLTIKADDLTIPVSSTTTQSLEISIGNTAPIITVPGAQSLKQDTSLTLIPDIWVADAETVSGDLRMTLTCSYGTMTLKQTTGLNFEVGTGANDHKLTFTGNQLNINAALSGMTYTPPAAWHGTDNMTVAASDLVLPTPGTDSKAFDIVVSAANVPPVITVPGAQSISLNETLSLNGITVSDTDLGSGRISVTVGVAHGTLRVPLSGTVVGNGTSSLNITDSLSRVNSALAGLTYAPQTNYTGSDAISITADDQGIPDPGTDVANIPISISNASPQISVPGAFSVSGNVSTPISGLSVTDADIGDGNLTLSLSVSHGTLGAQAREWIDETTYRISTITGSTVTFSDKIAWVNNALAGLTYTPTPKYAGTDQLLVSAIDQAFPKSGSDTEALGITVTNSAPSVTAPTGISVVAGASMPIGGISLSDPDLGATSLTLVVNASHGILTVADAASVVGNNTKNLNITDTLPNVNALVAGLQYTPVNDYTGADVLTITANDLATPTPGTDTASVSMSIDVAANVPPDITVPAAQTVSMNTPKLIGGISIADADIGTDAMSVTLSVSHGTINVAAAAESTTVTGNNTAIVRIVDTLPNVNALVAGLQYTPVNDYTGADVLTITANDLATPTPGTDTEQISITVSSVAPGLPAGLYVTVPPFQTVNEDSALTITPAISVSYSDSYRELKVSLDAAHGKMTLGWKGGLSSYTDDGTASVGFTGTLTNVNAALNGLRYAPLYDYNGTDRLSITVDDQSGSSGGTVSGSVELTVNPINDPPVLTIAVGNQQVSVNSSSLVTGLSVRDVDAADNNITVAMKVLHGTLSVQGGVPATAVTIEDTVGNIDARLRNLVYAPFANYIGPDFLSISVQDNGHTGSGGVLSCAGMVRLDVR